jgi:hypothetical protein
MTSLFITCYFSQIYKISVKIQFSAMYSGRLPKGKIKAVHDLRKIAVRLLGI